jgi:hypothetical protein
MGLAHKGPGPPPYHDLGQSPQSRGSRPHRQRLYNGHVNQDSPLLKKEHYSDDPIPYVTAAVGCTTTPRLPPLRRRRLRLEYDNKPNSMEQPYLEP